MLGGIVVDIKELKDSDINSMFELMASYYDNIKKEIFLSDLNAKDHVILLRDEDSVIKGFSTIKLCKITAGGKPVNLLFSGDTIIHQDFWSNNELLPVWLKFALEKAGTLEEPLYWLLISKGYKTYKMITILFDEYYPKSGVQIPEFERAVMDEFGALFYGREYDKNIGIIYGGKDYLKEEFAQIPDNKIKEKRTAFFLEKNPHYAKGDELVCTALISRNNLGTFGRRIVGV